MNENAKNQQHQQALQIHHNDGLTSLVLNRPATHNAFDDALIQALIEALTTIAQDEKTQVVILRSEGKHFSAGADLAWMKRMADLNYEDNLADANELARLMKTLNDLPQPTIALVQGAAYGGAVGLACCCDIAIGTNQTVFCLSEVKLGLAPATIAPFVVNAIGQRQARHYMLTAKAITADTAERIGLLHEITDAETLQEYGESLAKNIMANGSQAVGATKALIRRVSESDINTDMIRYTTELIAQLRVSEEGQEGLSAFFDKRPPSWNEK